MNGAGRRKVKIYLRRFRFHSICLGGIGCHQRERAPARAMVFFLDFFFGWIVESRGGCGRGGNLFN